VPGFDIAQIRAVARQLGMSARERREFGRYVEDAKVEAQPDFSYAELIALGRNFLSERRGPQT
jgi:hypothetical protein